MLNLTEEDRLARAVPFQWKAVRWAMRREAEALARFEQAMPASRSAVAKCQASHPDFNLAVILLQTGLFDDAEQARGMDPHLADLRTAWAASEASHSAKIAWHAATEDVFAALIDMADAWLALAQHRARQAQARLGDAQRAEQTAKRHGEGAFAELAAVMQIDAAERALAKHLAEAARFDLLRTETIGAREAWRFGLRCDEAALRKGLDEACVPILAEVRADIQRRAWETAQRTPRQAMRA